MEYKYNFKKETPILETRLEESTKIREKYPNRVPIICERDTKSKLQMLEKTKYLVPDDLTIVQFYYIIRKKLSLDKNYGLSFLVNGKFSIAGENLISDIYSRYKDEDGFLYMTYTGELDKGC